MLIVVGEAEVILDICRENFRTPFFSRRLLLVPPYVVQFHEAILPQLFREYVEEVAEKRSRETNIEIRNWLVCLSRNEIKRLLNLRVEVVNFHFNAHVAQLWELRAKLLDQPPLC